MEETKQELSRTKRDLLEAMQLGRDVKDLDIKWGTLSLEIDLLEHTANTFWIERNKCLSYQFCPKEMFCPEDLEVHKRSSASHRHDDITPLDPPQIDKKLDIRTGSAL
ncbi:hypothetical protein QVD17_30272 [Tagetes erecta]|uniref:Uncharacterized protein n=1 Tax=Tagetes erecta TaxID=13708 RepID=A0AAD8NN38_TARER|nr:hypothetical protein QVD17_30272 [Tagetes erecta]